MEKAKCLLISIFLVSLFFSSIGYSQVIDSQTVITKCNEIMKNIYNDILKIKDKYKELEDFGEENYENTPEMAGQYKNIKSIDDDKSAIRICFSEKPYAFGFVTSPAYNIYIKEVGFYLVVYYQFSGEQNKYSRNPQLLDEIIKIVKRNMPAPK